MIQEIIAEEEEHLHRLEETAGEYRPPRQRHLRHRKRSRSRPIPLFLRAPYVNSFATC